MPAVQCLRGMNSPANGIFFCRRAALMPGRRRQETRCGRPRALLPPFPPEGAARRGGSKDREQSKGATGRTALMRVGMCTRGRPLLAGKRERVRAATGRHAPQDRRRRGMPRHGGRHDCRYRRRLRLHSMAGKWRRHARQCRAGRRRAGLPPVPGFGASDTAGAGLVDYAQGRTEKEYRASVRRERLPSGKPSEYSRLRPSPGGANPVFRGPFDAR